MTDWSNLLVLLGIILFSISTINLLGIREKEMIAHHRFKARTEWLWEMLDYQNEIEGKYRPFLL